MLQTAEDFGITLNEEKCEFAKEEIDFFGHTISKHGIKPSPKKIEAIRRAPRPESKKAVRSFLGMTGYLSKFIPRYSSLTEPLRKLTQKEVNFKWGPREEKEFSDLQNALTSDDTMIFFDPKRPITVRAEASYNEGLSAGLFQTTQRGLQPVHFASRTLTDTEKRYSQTEKDALAIRWAKDKFRMYL